MQTPKISIVMTYHERAGQLMNTLRSFVHHGYADEIEVIIVDDGSIAQKAEDCLKPFAFPVRLIYLEPAGKWYSNPCIPFNVGFKAARGEFVILQNAECLHYSNIVEDVAKHLHEEGDYRVYACYSLNREHSEGLNEAALEALLKDGYPFARDGGRTDGAEGWYHHSKFRNMPFHFCAALGKRDLARLGGFDERYARGIGYDDYEFLYRVRKSGMTCENVDDKIVMHQWHYQNRSPTRRDKKLMFRNNQLFRTVTVAGMPYWLFGFALAVSSPLGLERFTFRIINKVLKFLSAEQAEYYK